MSYIANEGLYLNCLRQFLNSKLNSENFCEEFMRLWKIDRDEEWANCEKWDKRYDLQLIHAYNQGKLTSEELKSKSAELWGYTENTLLVEMLGKIFTACDCFSPSPEFEFEINEYQLKKEVSEMLNAYEALRDPTTLES